VVRQIFDWIGRERSSIGDVRRRLTAAAILTPAGQTGWDRTTIWGLLRNPAYKGQAAFGKPAPASCAPGYVYHAGARCNHATPAPATINRPSSGCRFRCRPWWMRRCLTPCRRNWRKTGAGPGAASGGRSICCKACWSAAAAAMPSTANRSVQCPKTPSARLRLLPLRGKRRLPLRRPAALW